MDMKQDQSLTLHVSEGHPVSTLHVPNSSMTLNDVLKVNGFTPRDGSFRFLVDEQGTMINHREAGRAPSTVRCAVPDNVEQLWISENPVQGFASAVRSNGSELVVLNGRAFEFQTVFVTKKKRGSKKRRVAYSFSPEPPFYENQGLVFLQVPLKGDVGQIFNPQTGRVDWNVRLQVAPRDIERMRGFWSVWEMRGDLRSATFRTDITPLPANFKPHFAPKPQHKGEQRNTKPANPKKAKSKMKRKRTVKLKKFEADAWYKGLHKCVVFQGSRPYPALVCGGPRKPLELKGTLVATGNLTRPAMVNLDGFRYGMTQFIKIPEEGNNYEIWFPNEKKFVPCVIESTAELQLDQLRNRWVIARLRRSHAHGRKLVLEALPSRFHSKVN